ncbi:MAG: hypothetical protein F4087_09625 [Gemmatimonadetes bacterium]|nr:hypothetical protein [Gemmatimonadota bacterium]MYE69185.1 hypothetical protein [Gemmatimonadota bacterium]MYJ68751.1 hypothetical protein [Gemmatimonadota bacterium]
MRYKLLGRSGLRVSEVCLGTMMMSTESPSSAGPEESRRYDSEFWQQLAFQFDERAFDIARKVDEIADRLGTSSAAVALAWVRDRGVIPMIGARKVSQIEDSLRYLSLTLPDEDMQALTEASAPVLPWTYYLLHSDEIRIRQLATGGMLDAIDNERFPF